MINCRLFARGLATVGTAVKNEVADVVIIGGGPAGLSLGAGLKNSPATSNLKIKIIESLNLLGPLKDFEKNAPEFFTNRVVSLTPTTVDFFKEIGSWKFIKEDRIQSYDDIIAYDGITNAKIEFTHDDIATMCENINIQSSLLERIEELNNNDSIDNQLEILDNTKVVNIGENDKNHWPVLELSNGTKIETRLLIGCDGFNSPARKFAKIENRGWSYNRWGIVATLQNEHESFRMPVAWQRFLPTGPIALLPMPDNYVSLVWTLTPELSNIAMKVKEENFVLLVNAAYRLDQDELNYIFKIAQDDEDSLPAELSWRLKQFSKNKDEKFLEENYPIMVSSMISKSRGKFPLKLSHSDTYVSERVALVGDAAHTTHPLAGQGLNMGQGDVKSLVKALEKASLRGLDIGSPLSLEPYFSERWPENHVLLGVVDKLHKIYSTDFMPIVKARSLGVDILNNLDFVKEFMIKQISGK
ncbi:hypothetical protein PACTADRAFT_49932 [Pachysolen tannophilus NRRL Y-2460]|uniref:Ubiquinone biosynthesis monooxygenase COQ6, mitochondrial n=1 Tax=Pachysolen tannophilus NRRL Y-2460 TaxID=669874 RepID=A0A1E4TTY7_PACTA|nr:hypothetical protein PACTADRAFT_49932 [Pachysolen tannophilus NRRL Y-2460]